MPRLEDRIRAHILLCWLALLLTRIAETTTNHTWPTIRAELNRLHLVTFTGPAGTFRQTTELTKPQRDLLAALNLTPPKKIIEVAARSGHASTSADCAHTRRANHDQRHNQSTSIAVNKTLTSANPAA